MKTYLAALALSSILIGGCTTVNIPENIVTGPATLPAKTANMLVAEVTNAVASGNYSKLTIAYLQVKGIRTASFLTNAGVNPHDLLPSIFVNDASISKMVAASFETLTNGQPQNASISKSDLKLTTRMLQYNFGVSALNPAYAKMMASRLDTDTTAYNIAQAYLYAYFTGTNGFIDRQGTKYTAPTFSGSIANPEITAATGIVFEAIYDSILDTPVWTTNSGKAATKTGATPTALTLKFAKGEELAAGDGHIDQNKLDVMNFLAQLAGMQSKTVAGMVVRLIGKVNVGFAIEGGLSFGDNQTFAQIIDQIFQTSAQRLTIATTTRIFRKLNYSSDKQSMVVADSGDSSQEAAKYLMDQLIKTSSLNPQ